MLQPWTCGAVGTSYSSAICENAIVKTKDSAIISPLSVKWSKRHCKVSKAPCASYDMYGAHQSLRDSFSHDENKSLSS